MQHLRNAPVLSPLLEGIEARDLNLHTLLPATAAAAPTGAGAVLESAAWALLACGLVHGISGEQLSQLTGGGSGSGSDGGGGGVSPALASVLTKAE